MTDVNTTQRDASADEVIRFFDGRYSRKMIAFCIDNGLSVFDLVGCGCCASRPQTCWADGGCDNFMIYDRDGGYCDAHADQRGA